MKYLILAICIGALSIGVAEARELTPIERTINDLGQQQLQPQWIQPVQPRQIQPHRYQPVRPYYDTLPPAYRRPLTCYPNGDGTSTCY